MANIPASADQSRTTPLEREMLDALRHIIGAANEAPKFGPFDCIDNAGQYYQSADFAAGLNKARAILARESRYPSPDHNAR